MLLADWIGLAVLVVFAGIGALIGFGRGLKFLTGGIFGIIISVVLCYIFGSMILGIGFVNDLLDKLAEAMGGWSIIVLVIYYVVLFIIFWLLRKLIVKLIANIVEANVLVMKIINKVLGAVLFGAFGLLLGLLALQIIYWVQGGVGMDATIFWNSLVNPETFEPSAIVGQLYINNPLAALADYFNQIVALIKGGEAAAVLCTVL